MPKLRRQSEEDLGLSVDAEDNSPGLLDGSFSRQVSPEMPQEHLHPCSPRSNVEDSFSKDPEFSEQDSSAVMDSIYSSFGTWEARRSFTKLRQDLVHRQRMIQAVSRRHRRVLTTARCPGTRPVEEEPPRRKRVAASRVSKTEIREQRQSSASPTPELKMKPRGFKELFPKAWKKRNLPRCKAENGRSGSKVPVSSSPRQKYLPQDVHPSPSPVVEGRWESVKHSASFNGPNLEAIMVQRSLRKQIIRSLRLQPRMEAKELHDVLGDSQRWTPEVPSARWSSRERLRLLDLAGLDADLQEEVETVATPTSHGFHRPARRFPRPTKRQPDRPATVGPSTCQIPPLDLDCEGGVWSKLDRTEDESP